MSTSASDQESYLSVCRSAAANDAVFAQFKRAPGYRQILEHVSYIQGLGYLNAIRRTAPDLLEHADEFRRNDLRGSPETFAYPDVGELSPTTLRYIKVAADLVVRFGKLDGASIVEVGGGYGGQARILHALFSNLSYTIIDLPEPLGLADRFLRSLGVASVKCAAMRDVVLPIQSDLFLSNYALDECSPDMYRVYFDNLVKYTSRGYVTGRASDMPGLDTLPMVSVVENEPCKLAGYYMIAWGPCWLG